MNKSETLGAIAVMRHFASGGEIQYFARGETDQWEDCPDPIWAWEDVKYRIKPQPRSFTIAVCPECGAITGASQGRNCIHEHSSVELIRVVEKS